MGFWDAIKDFFVSNEDYEAEETVISEVSPEVDITLTKSEAKDGGVIEGFFTVKGVSANTMLKSVSVETYQGEDYLGGLTIPYLGRIIEKDEIVKDSFSVQLSRGEVKPSGGDISHHIKIDVECQTVRGEAEKEITVVEGKDEFAELDRNYNFIIPEEVDFLHSSVRGELRMFAFSSGFVISWNDQISVRDKNGYLLWKLDGPGRTIAVSPDGSKMVTSWHHDHLLSFIDMKTGEILGEKPTDDYVDYLVWLDDNSGIVAASGENTIKLLDTSGNLVKNITQKKIEFIGSMIQVPGEHKLYVLDSNGDKICIVDSDKGKLLKKAETYATDEVFLSPDKSWLGLIGGSDFEIIKASNLARIFESSMPGYYGVQHSRQTDGSCRAWEAKLRIHQDNNRFVINCKDGQLRLFELQSKTYKDIPRDIINFVEDTLWIDENTLAVIDSLGYFYLLNTDTMKVTLKEKDYE